MIALPHFYRKWFQLRHSKICKKLKNTLFKRSQHSLLNLRLLQNYFLGMLLCPNFELNSFYRFASLCQKMVSTLWLKNLQKKLKNVLFKRSEHSFLILKLLQNHFLRMFLCPNLNRFEHFTSLSRKTVSTSSFQKFAKSWKMPFSNAQNIRYWAQGSFKMIF